MSQWWVLLGLCAGFLLGHRIGRDAESIRTFRIAREALSTPEFVRLMDRLRPEKPKR